MSAEPSENTAPQNAPAIRIYQPYLNAGERGLLDERAVAFDISFNTAPNAREYELFKALAVREVEANPRDFWGLVSSKFALKAPIDFEQLHREAEAAMLTGHDCFIVNPMIGLSAIYLNVKEHANAGGHPGMGALFQMLQSLGCPVDAPQGSQSFFFCNYIIGNERFWTGYFGFCDAILAKLEDEAGRGTDVGKAYTGGANYSRDASATMRPFLIERLLGYYLQLSGPRGLKIAVHRPEKSDFERKFGVRLGQILSRLFEMKEDFMTTGNRNGFQDWLKTRTPIVQQPQLVWQLDDPPRWML